MGINCMKQGLKVTLNSAQVMVNMYSIEAELS